jgi:hypothetical protein
MVMFSDKNSDEDEIFIMSPKSRHEDTNWDFGQIPKVLEWWCQNMEDSTILRYFWGIFDILE